MLEKIAAAADSALSELAVASDYLGDGTPQYAAACIHDAVQALKDIQSQLSVWRFDTSGVAS